jgi:ATP-dependent DNA helicase RecQ
MIRDLKPKALSLLQKALDNPTANFREGQWEAINELIEQRARLLIVQRTGWGKSLVYFLTTRLLRDQGAGPTLLISPLLALMRNQILAAERIGIRAATINSSNREEWTSVQTRLEADEVDILLISPEKLANEDFREQMLLPIANRIGCFVVDEAHCISDWGHDFRPDYRRITRILQALPQNVPVLATTATANNRVVNDIAQQLGPNLQVLRGPLTRESLQLQNIQLSSQAARLAWLAEQLPTLSGSGIIYALTIKDAEQVARWLRTQGINVEAYTGQIEKDKETGLDVRQALENRLLNNEVKALVATSALGMGFDKPDLGFVIHYQRPGSVVHYYQQVGRAGRAVDLAYGILLSGDEDQAIVDYFIQSAFPPERHVQDVLDALSQADDGLSVPGMERQLNLSRGQIDKVVKILATESPAPITRQGSKWYVTPISYQPNREKVEELIQIRRQEQTRMMDYAQSQECLMVFLSEELDDPNSSPCCRCAICLGKPLLPVTYSSALALEAIQFLRRSDLVIEPRKQWPAGTPINGWSGKIGQGLQAETGRALSLWGDEGWGKLVKRGKYTDNSLDDELVKGAAEMVQRWQPQPCPTWVTCVPSLNRPDLVPNFARRLAQQLGLPFFPSIQKIRSTKLQKQMKNSYQQAHNLENAFEISTWSGMDGPVFLVDDMVDFHGACSFTTASWQWTCLSSCISFKFTQTGGVTDVYAHSAIRYPGDFASMCELWSISTRGTETLDLRGV